MDRKTKFYILTLVALTLHQIDAAYWQEWNMFRLPGGIQGFLLFNLLAFPPLFVGLYQLGRVSAAVKSISSRTYGLVCGGLGVITGIIHGIFAMFGYLDFSLPFSIFTIVCCFVFGTLTCMQFYYDKD